MSPAYYRRVDDAVFDPTEEVGGAWHDDEQHFSPLSGLIVQAVAESRAARPDGPGTIARISHDILGVIPRERTTIEVRVLRPGWTIELVEAVTSVGGRAVVDTRVWLLADTDSAAVAGTETAALPPPLAWPSWPMSAVWPGGYIAGLQVHRDPESRPGRARVWLGTDRELLAGEPVDPVARYCAMIDTANGIAVRADPQAWIFPNVDLTVHLHRTPVGEWTGLDTTVSMGPTGQGVTATVLHDLDGPVGTAAQSLTVRPRPAGQR